MKILEQMIDLIFPPRQDEQHVRCASASMVAELVSPTLINIGTGVYTNGSSISEIQATVLLPFRKPLVRSLIHEAKYRGNKYAFELLGGVLRDYLFEWTAEEGFGEICLVSIPLSATRKKERGYNQVEKVLQYTALDGLFNISDNILIRLRDTASQTTLSGSARRKNMCGAFGTTPNLDLSCTYIIIDDVLTTGATMRSAADTLTSAGVTRVIYLALAH